MSNPGDQELVELSFEFEGLSISIRGSPSSSASFVRGLSARGSSASSEAAPSPSGISSVSSPPVTAASASTVESRPVPAVALYPGRNFGPAQYTETRASIEAGFRPLPGEWRALAVSRLGRGPSDPEWRANRAWKAGSWARAVIDLRASSPNRTPTICSPNRYWVVLRSERCVTPRVFTSSNGFFNAVGSLELSETVCHAWPSLLEAQIYVAAAGFTFPDPE
eukprot:Skav235937  [mRNA]  locus=scaffold4666:2042:2707:- [translate_table: standard]